MFDGQYAIHGTNALGGPAAHGCVRRSPRHAAMLFAMVQSQGAVIRIVGDPPTRMAQVRHAAHALAYAPAPRQRSPKAWARDPAGR